MGVVELIRKEFEAAYEGFHGCGLKKPERGLKVGRLCDSCLEMVEEHLKHLGLV